jgi:iron complex outermembrane receptor protein
VDTAKSIFLILIASVPPTLVSAQSESPAESEPDEVIVTSTRQPRRIADEPSRVEVIDSEELEEKVAMSPGDVAMLLNETSGLRVQTTSPGLGAANVRIEGLRGRYSQILADGLPLYGGQTGSTGLLQIPPLDLGQVEVLKGVASALYGASAIGGVVNFISRRPDDSLDVLVNQTTRQGTDAAVWWSGAPNTDGWSESMVANASRQIMQDVDGDGWADMPSFRRASLRPRVYWKGEGGSELFLTAGAMLEDRTGGTVKNGTVPADDVAGEPFVEALKTHRYDVGMRGKWPLADERELTLRSSFTHRDSEQSFGEELEQSRSNTLSAEVAMSGVSYGHSWVVGSAFQQDTYRDATFPGFNFTYNVPGLFAQDEYELGDAITLSGSARLDHHNLYGTFLSPRLAALWRPGGRSSPWRVRLSLGTGFFAPTPITEETEATGLSRVLPLTNLQAERAQGASLDVNRLWTLELGSLETNITVFDSQVAHAVNLVEVSSVSPRIAFENDPQPTRNFGTELLLRWRAGPMTLTAAHAYVNSTEFPADSTGRLAVPLNPRHTGTLTLVWEKSAIGRVGLECFFTGHQALTGADTDNPYRASSPAYAIFGLLLQRQVGPVSVILNGENLADRRLTRVHPLLLPTRAADGRWTVDAWGPLDGRVINLEARWRISGH